MMANRISGLVILECVKGHMIYESLSMIMILGSHNKRHKCVNRIFVLGVTYVQGN